MRDVALICCPCGFSFQSTVKKCGPFSVTVALLQHFYGHCDSVHAFGRDVHDLYDLHSADIEICFEFLTYSYNHNDLPHESHGNYLVYIYNSKCPTDVPAVIELQRVEA